MTRPTTEPTTAFERARELLERATPGPWQCFAADHLGSPRRIPSSFELYTDDGHGNGDGLTCRPDLPNGAPLRDETDANAELIALAVNLLPALLEVAEAAQVACWFDRASTMPKTVKENWFKDGRPGTSTEATDAIRSALARLEEVQP